MGVSSRTGQHRGLEKGNAQMSDLRSSRVAAARSLGDAMTPNKGLLAPRRMVVRRVVMAILMCFGVLCFWRGEDELRGGLA